MIYKLEFNQNDIDCLNSLMDITVSCKIIYKDS